MHVREFQEMMRRLYFQKDLDRGVKETYDWLVDEVEELGCALNGENQGELEGEFADVIAWLASLANITRVDLECAAVTKYNNRCPKCKQLPCECKF